MKRRVFFSYMGLGLLTSICPELIALAIDSNKQKLALDSKVKEIKPIVFFVALDGNDKWSGTLETPNVTKTDGPFATLNRAKQAIRQIKKQQEWKLQQPITVLIRGGTYFLPKPLLFQPEDSGTEEFPITYQSYKDEQPIFSGGRLITGWQEETVRGIPMWTVTLPQVQSGKWSFQHLWVNGEKRSRSRYPTTGYLKLKSIPENSNQQWHQGNNSFYYHEGDIQSWDSITQGEVVVMNRWVESRLPITQIDESRQIIHFAKESVFKLATGNLYYIDNIFEVLDTPGQWYLNRQTGKLYYIPLPGEEIGTTEIIAPVLVYLVLLRGKSPNNPAIKNSFVKYIQFRNLTFCHNDWRLSPKLSGYSQNAYGVPGAIFAKETKFCTWENCIFAHLGSYALELFRGCEHNSLVGCKMFDLGAGGIKIGERETKIPNINSQQISHNNQVINNHIYDGGKFFPSAVALRACHSHDNLIARNHIHDFYYTAISTRGTWGYIKTSTYSNTIEGNYIHHIGKLSNGDGPILSDMGAIYTLGMQKGTVISGNCIHNVTALRYGGWGIYFDEGSSYILAENNLVYQTTNGGFCQHYGKENIITNNIFAFGKKSQINRAKTDYLIAKKNDFTSFRFERNIVYWNQGSLIGSFKNNFGSQTVFDNNLYYRPNRETIFFGDMSWEQWQLQGKDNHSLIGDPLFFAPEEGDFRLQANSPALKLGFQPINYSLSTS